MNPAFYIGYLWPVPPREGRLPVVSHEFEPGPRYLPGTHTLNYKTHLGVDILYRRLPTDPSGPPSHVALSPHGPGFIAFDHTPIRAVGPGKVWSAKRTGLGLSVQIDHGQVDGAGMLTFYQHMSEFTRNWQKGDVVLPGTVLGIMGGDPSNDPHLLHCHFEVWRPDGKADEQDWPVDPAPYLTHFAQV